MVYFLGHNEYEKDLETICCCSGEGHRFLTEKDWDTETIRRLQVCAHENGAFGVLCTDTELLFYMVKDQKLWKVAPLQRDKLAHEYRFFDGEKTIVFKTLEDFFWNYGLELKTMVVCAVSGAASTNSLKLDALGVWQAHIKAQYQIHFVT